MSFRSTIQTISLFIFLLLLMITVSSVFINLNTELFLRLDPVIVLGTSISGRTFSLAFIPAIIVLLLVPIMGRAFCGYICPMGTTIDGSDKLFDVHVRDQAITGKLRRIKYYVLSFLIGSSLLGISLVFTVSPISLITRFYGLLIEPILALLGHMVLSIVQPLTERLTLNALVYADLNAPRFATQFFILIFFVVIFASAKVSSRFWCRYICPSGALMALLSKRPVYRRRVSDDCTNCGKCISSCPMNAIKQDAPEVTCHEECIICKDCKGVCPVDAVSFSREETGHTNEDQVFLPARRELMIAGLAGFGTAAVNLTGLNSFYGKPGVGQIASPGLIRPPGAVPEKDFLALCVRCGQCMIGCPTNGLQPIWTKAGFAGLFSPALVPRRGACNHECNNCGVICPTGAIRDLPIQERIWAKLGTAMILREKCLAWEHQKKCMVCDEVCPFGAVKFRYEPGNPVPVPEVSEDRCSGCGYCEHHCPVQNRSAIIVTPMGSLRIGKGSFREKGEQQGLKISLRHREDIEQPIIQGGNAAPGFEKNSKSDSIPNLKEDNSKRLAPGFTE
ncbi:4Fe-4S binding protein [Thermodesulfobacteriota bacterium]